ncbi:hypothetical protein Tco_0470122, partial [Tanacetum coccineum]
AMITADVANALPNLTAALRTQITNDIKNGGGDAVPHGRFLAWIGWLLIELPLIAMLGL